jgi:hypothetical protein
MPNWCSNSFEIKCDTTSRESIESFQEIVKIIKKDKNMFRSESFFPTPEELSKISSGSHTIDGVAYHHWLTIHGKGVPVPEEMVKELLEKYGCLNWYDWNLNNLGTKWHFDSVDVVDLTSNVIEFNADTAWSPPTEFCCNISQKFPGIYIKLAFFEPGCGFAGVENIFDGEIITSEEHTPKWLKSADRFTRATEKWLERNGLSA